MQDKTQFNAMLKRRSEKAPLNPAQKNNPFTTELLKRESVRCSALVGSSEWDSYLGYIESILAGYKELKQAAIDGLEDPKIIEHTDLIQVKMVLREASAVIGVLDQLIKLPYVIIHEHDSAKEVASKIPLPKIPDFLNEKT